MSGVALTPSADGRMLDGRHSLDILLLCFDHDDHAHGIDGINDDDDGNSTTTYRQLKNAAYIDTESGKSKYI